MKYSSQIFSLLGLQNIGSFAYIILSRWVQYGDYDEPKGKKILTSGLTHTVQPENP